MTVLQSKIEAYRSTYAAWIATSANGDLETDNAEFETFAEVELDLVRFPCTTSDEVQTKVKFFGETRELRDTIVNDVTDDGKRYISLFIDSLVLEEDLR